MEPSTLGLRVKQARTAWTRHGHRITQADVAAAIGVRPTQVNYIETGRTQDLKSHKVGLLATYLRCTTDYLLGLNDEGPDYEAGHDVEPESALTG